MYVLTVDQRASRTAADLVPGLLDELNTRRRQDGLLRRFERTAGDEVQGVLSSPSGVVETIVSLLRSDAWYVGLGMGEVVEPLPRSTRAGRGSAFVHAREAVSRAKSSPHPVGVVGDDPYRAEQVETVLWLLSAVLRRRTGGGWEVADLLSDGLTQSEAAERLGISASAVSQRVHAAGVIEEQRGRVLLVQLLEQGAGR